MGWSTPIFVVQTYTHIHTVCQRDYAVNPGNKGIRACRFRDRFLSPVTLTNTHVQIRFNLHLQFNIIFLKLIIIIINISFRLIRIELCKIVMKIVHIL